MLSKNKCPQCGYSADIAFEECHQCGVIIKKFVEAQKRQEKQKRIKELEKKIVEKEKKIKRTKYGWFRKLLLNKYAIIPAVFVVIVLCGYGIKLYLSLNNKGKHSLEITEYSKAIDLAPNNATAYYNRGNAYSNSGKYQKAIEDYNHAIRLNPDIDNAATYFNRGNAYFDSGKYQKAIEDYNQVIRLNPNNDSAYCNRADIFTKFGEHQQAIENYDKAIRLNPNNANAYLIRGENYRVLGQYKRAIKDYNQAIRFDPNNSQSYSGRGLVYYHLNKNKKAINDYNQAIRLDPNDLRDYVNRGAVYMRLGQYKRAIKDYNQALHINPNNATAKEALIIAEENISGKVNKLLAKDNGTTNIETHFYFKVKGFVLPSAQCKIEDNTICSNSFLNLVSFRLSRRDGNNWEIKYMLENKDVMFCDKSFVKIIEDHNEFVKILIPKLGEAWIWKTSLWCEL